MQRRLVPCALALILLHACTSLARLDAVPPTLTEKAEIPEIPAARVWLDGDLGPFVQAVIRDTEREVRALERAGLASNPLPDAHVLAISGGGDDGAFAAGILVGWTARGNRPQFKVVTGTSAGALIAPFAFLGSEYDAVLRTVATSVSADDVLRRRIVPLGLLSDGMASSEPLGRIVARFVTPELLAEIAREHESGRVLQVASTDLDSGRQVVWNLGEIASSSAPHALDLFRQIIVASASIPGTVSPVMIDVEVDGKRYQEMHVDGGVISQVFLYPSRLLPELAKATGQPLGREIHTYVIRNGRFEPDWNNTKRRTMRIGDRAIRALVQAQGINDVRQLYQIARQDGAGFKLAYIGSELDRPDEEFDAAYMQRLYEYGYDLGATGNAWHESPPN